MKTTPPVVIFGIDCLTGLQAARILWRKNIPVIGVASDPKSPYCRTRAAVKTVPFAELKENPHPLLKSLEAQYGARPVALPCTDEFVWWLNDRREDVSKQADFLLPPCGTLRLLADKVQFYRYAIEHKLPLPDTRFVKSVEEIKKAADEMTFPLILKPARHSPEWMAASGGFKVVKVADAAELLRAGPALCAAVGELILQMWVRGPDANMHSLYICMDRQSDPLCCLVAKKLRQWPPDVGSGSLAVEVRADEVVNTGVPILKQLGYVGPGSFQFKQDAVDGKIYIIEMNVGRPALNFSLCEACGVEMIYTCYCAAAGLPLPGNRTVIRPGSKWICWKTDLASAYAHWKRGDLTVLAWLASLRGRKRPAEISLTDPMPMLIDMARKMRRGISASARKILLHDHGCSGSIMTPKAPVLLLGSDCLTGLQAARILWRKKVPVIGVANDPRSPYCRTRSVVRTVPSAGFMNDPRPLLRELQNQCGARPVMLACTDDFVWWLNAHREVMEECANFLLPPPCMLQMQADKTRFYRYVAKNGLPLPETRFMTGREELERAAREMRFPLILKPALRTRTWLEAAGGLKVVKVDDPETLLRLAPALQAVTGELILQSWIRGPDANMRELSVCLGRHSELLAGIVLQKIRQWPLDVGSGSLSVENHSEEVMAAGLDILRKLNYAGVGQLEFKKDEVDGVYYIIELNAGRAALNFPLCEICGVELTYTYYCAAAGLPLPENRTVTRPGSKWICWKTDLAAAYVHWRRGELTIREWLISLRGRKWSADVQFDDLVPLLADMSRKILRLKKSAPTN
jgi:D-aspartate ligase